jgi:hypothetical protein
VIDNEVRAWPARKIRYGVSVNDSRGCEEIPGGGLVGCAVTGRCRPPLIVEIVEAAKRIDNSSLKKREKLFGFAQKPSAMAR